MKMLGHNETIAFEKWPTWDESLLGEDDDEKFIKTFVVIEVIYYVAYIVLDLLGIYI